LAYANASGTATVTRSNLLGSDALVGADAGLKTIAASGRLGWGFALSSNAMITPYLGLISTKATRNNYAETGTDGVQAPFSFASYSVRRSSTQLGVELSGKPNENLTTRVNVALENSRQDISDFSVSGAFGTASYTPGNAALTGLDYNAGFGMSYSINPKMSVSLNGALIKRSGDQHTRHFIGTSLNIGF
jgi:outer membrane protein assembly factor BamA